MPPVEAAWLAGLLEGEGSFTALRSVSESRPSQKYRVSVFMTDRDVLERLVEYTGVGPIRAVKETPNRLGTKPLFCWTTQRLLEVRDICIQVRPWMGQRRGERIDTILSAIADATSFGPGFCTKGHQLTPDNLCALTQGGRCRICHNIRQAKYAKARASQGRPGTGT
jgi:hypothetical protein